MKPVFPNESPYARALFAARLHLKGTMLTAEAMLEICEELIGLDEELIKLQKAGRPPFAAPTPAADPPSAIEPGRLCTHGVPYSRPCAACDAARKSGMPWTEG